MLEYGYTKEVSRVDRKEVAKIHAVVNMENFLGKIPPALRVDFMKLARDLVLLGRVVEREAARFGFQRNIESVGVPSSLQRRLLLYGFAGS